MVLSELFSTRIKKDILFVGSIGIQRGNTIRDITEICSKRLLQMTKFKIGDMVEYKGDAGIIIREDREHYYVRWFDIIGEWCYVKTFLNKYEFDKLS
jgi:hypothetical protein